MITVLVVEDTISGRESICDYLRQGEGKVVSAITCISKNQDLDRMWGMKQGVDIYLTKPFQAVRSLALGV